MSFTFAVPIAKWDNDVHNTPAYPLTDAARYLHIPAGTLRAWVNGRYYSTREGKQYFEPLIQRPEPDVPQISFTNLIEAHVLSSIRKPHGVRLDQVRNALDSLDKRFQMPHPLARVEFQPDGVNIFVESIGRLVRSVSEHDQLAIKIALKNLLTRVEWNEEGMAARLFPTSRDMLETAPTAPKSVEIDPQVSFGRPVIVGTGIPTIAIAERYQAGESPDSIADDLGCDIPQVHDAIRFELV
ncbi:MAG: DUF433 domain-containing protein [Cyanobacteria bacterium J06634_5]